MQKQGKQKEIGLEETTAKDPDSLKARPKGYKYSALMTVSAKPRVPTARSATKPSLEACGRHDKEAKTNRSLFPSNDGANTLLFPH